MAGDWHAQLWKLSDQKEQTVPQQRSGYTGCSGKEAVGGHLWLLMVAGGC